MRLPYGRRIGRRVAACYRRGRRGAAALLPVVRPVLVNLATTLIADRLLHLLGPWF